jgi:hypothetical protein
LDSRFVGEIPITITVAITTTAARLSRVEKEGTQQESVAVSSLFREAVRVEAARRRAQALIRPTR